MVKDCPLDLNPNTTYPRESVASVESDVLSEEEPEGDQWTSVTHKRQSPRRLSPKRGTEEQQWVNHYANKGLPVGWAEQGSKCDRCQQVIADSVWRLYPTNVVLIFQPFPRVETGDQIP